MTPWRITAAPFVALAFSCSGGDDSVFRGAQGGSGDPSATSSTASASTGASGQGGGGGSSFVESEVICSSYCANWLACDDKYPSLEACQTACLDDIDSASLGGNDCFAAYRGLLQCLAGLACDDLANWANPDEPCSPASEAVANGC